MVHQKKWALLISIFSIFFISCCTILGSSASTPAAKQQITVVVEAPQEINPTQQEIQELPTATAAEQSSQEELEPTVEIPLAADLSPQGPWILFKTADGIWAMNQDGSGLTQLVTGKVVGPSDLAAGYHAPYLAFVTTSDVGTLQDLTLQIITVPDGNLVKSIRLTSADTEPRGDVEICEPRFEAARAVKMDNGLAWNQDGTQLAFVGSIEGPTSDLYIYRPDEDRITQLTDGPSQAYSVNWSRSGEYIVHFGASCFGTGAGFNMDGAWAARADDSGVISLYDTSGSSGETFIANYWSAEDSFYVTSFSGGCGNSDLRLVEIESQTVTMVHEGCFLDYATGPTGLIAVVTDDTFSDQPGLFIYAERMGDEFPVTFSMPIEDGREVDIQFPLVLVETLPPSADSFKVVSLDLNGGNQGWYQRNGEIPQIGPDVDRIYVWQEGNNFYLFGDTFSSPQLLSDQGGKQAFWIEDTSGQVTMSRLFYFSGDNFSNQNLFIASAPDYQPVTLAENLEPIGGFVQVRGSQ